MEVSMPYNEKRLMVGSQVKRMRVPLTRKQWANINLKNPCIPQISCQKNNLKAGRIF
jgi:hypothetical protein